MNNRQFARSFAAWWAIYIAVIMAPMVIAEVVKALGIPAWYPAAYAAEKFWYSRLHLNIMGISEIPGLVLLLMFARTKTVSTYDNSVLLMVFVLMGVVALQYFATILNLVHWLFFS